MANTKLNYVRGSFSLESNITDANEYYNKHKSAIDKIIAWANEAKIYVGFGTSGDCTYLCEYEVRRSTKALCKGFASELKAMLKQEWKNVRTCIHNGKE